MATLCQNVRRLVGNKITLQKPSGCENAAFKTLSLMERFIFPPSGRQSIYMVKLKVKVIHPRNIQ